jgi:hypothetical protein
MKDEYGKERENLALSVLEKEKKRIQQLNSSCRLTVFVSL